MPTRAKNYSLLVSRSVTFHRGSLVHWLNGRAPLTALPFDFRPQSHVASLVDAVANFSGRAINVTNRSAL